jgi:hypothetical protein
LPTVCDWPDPAKKGFLLGTGRIRLTCGDVLPISLHGFCAARLLANSRLRTPQQLSLSFRALGIDLSFCLLAQANNGIEVPTQWSGLTHTR